MTRRLLLGTISSEPIYEEKVAQSNVKGSHTEIYMLTDRSTAGNALIHDQSNTIIESSDSDEESGIRGPSSPDKSAVKLKATGAPINHQTLLQNSNAASNP